MYKNNLNLKAKAKELRKNMTPEERRLWYDFLKDYRVRFLRQRIIGNYIVDFYCPKARLAIEVDGSQHYVKRAERRDSFRTTTINEFGITVIRIPNEAVNVAFAEVCDYIDAVVTEKI